MSWLQTWCMRSLPCYHMFAFPWLSVDSIKLAFDKAFFVLPCSLVRYSASFYLALVNANLNKAQRIGLFTIDEALNLVYPKHSVKETAEWKMNSNLFCKAHSIRANHRILQFLEGWLELKADTWLFEKLKSVLIEYFNILMAVTIKDVYKIVCRKVVD